MGIQTEVRPRLLEEAYTVAVIALGAGIFIGTLGHAASAASTDPIFWVMAGLSVLAAWQAFTTTRPGGAVVVISPTICFTFAILLCWGLGPALVAQLAAVIAVMWRLRLPPAQWTLAAGQYTLAFAAAHAVLLAGAVSPLNVGLNTNLIGDVAGIVAAIATWLAVFGVLATGAAWLRGGSLAREAAGIASYPILFTAALLLLSPVLAVTALVNVAFVPLIFVPLYAVERMARLSSERDRAARLDPLTGLSNRTGLKARFDELSATPGHGRRLALFILDLDRFKHVNDALGHDVGDQLLVAVAWRLAGAAPQRGLVARLGGDEFAVLTCVDDAVEAHEVASRIVAALSDPVTLEGLRVDVTASVGIAVNVNHGGDFATLMREADVAMYEAKQRGDTIAIYEPRSDYNTPERLGLLTDFRHALETNDRDQIQVHYQPQMSLKDGHIVGVEALLRWRHPTYGPISTPELLQVAEHTAVMHLLTNRVIDDVVAQVAAWAAEGIVLRASLNVSARDLYSGDVVAHLASQLKRHGVPPSQIQVEITESALMADPARALATTARISALGVALALDDFGTGYSSLQHLRKLPLTELKIDRSFVCGMAHNSDDAAIVASTVGMARSLGLRTVAEGVETEYTRQLLADMGCAFAQGWLTARPMPGDDLPAWLALAAGATAAPTPSRGP